MAGLRVLCVGTCQIGWLVDHADAAGAKASHMLYESRPHEAVFDVDQDDFDLIIVAPTLRIVLHQAVGSSLLAGDVALARTVTEGDLATLVEACDQVIGREVSRFAQAFSRKPIFFMSFIEPSFNYIGRLASRFDPAAPHNVVRRLNALIERNLQNHPGGYLFDINEPLNLVGRAHLQDDIFASSSHASFISDWGRQLDQDRLQTSTFDEAFRTSEAQAVLGQLCWQGIVDQYKILIQDDGVKLVIVDLDDTLWRGVAAEDNHEQWRRTEGWPAGLVEALLLFKRRGGLLAICSKNEREATLKRLLTIYEGALTLDDFVSIKINWERKSDNVVDIIESVNLLPQNVLFIDDNPREIDEVKARLPALRTLSAQHYDWRRMLLQAPEMQVAAITAESRRRTETTRASVARKIDEAAMPRDEWLRSLALEQRLDIVSSESGQYFDRALELINKTNQFNTSGVRWTHGELSRFLAAGGLCVVGAVRDKLVDYGIVCVALAQGDEILQVVLSCRVFGLGVELAIGSFVTRSILRNSRSAFGAITDTGKNFACHKFFEQMGFQRVGEVFESTVAPEPPAWIKLPLPAKVTGELIA